MLSKNTTLKTLCFEKCCLYNIDLWVPELMENRGLTFLNLNFNYIRDVKDFCQGLSRNTTLTEIDMRNNPLDEKNLNVYFPLALSTNTTLKILKLGPTSFNVLDKNPVSGKVWGQVIRQNTSLQHLEVAFLTEKMAMMRALKKNTTLKCLDCKHTLFNMKEAFTIIRRILKKNTTLEHLYIDFDIKDEDCEPLDTEMNKHVFFTHVSGFSFIFLRNHANRTRKKKLHLFLFY
jgi:hypothetical protein